MQLRKILPLADLLLVPFIYPAAWLLKNIRRVGVARLPRCKSALFRVGVFPIQDHYYEPQFDNRHPSPEFSQNRTLPGIDWNIPEQLDMLSKFTHSSEFGDLPMDKHMENGFYWNNSNFGPGDAEYWYQIIRAIKPKRIIEIGSGNSTLMAIKALDKNKESDPDYSCEHICIEPYEMPFLEATGVRLIREKVEDVDLSVFANLGQNDILFIDSSHVIRPQGDVVFEYLELLPTLKPGVIVHIHDIFSPRNYPDKWLRDEVRLWNEQYLLEAFLSNNGCWKIIGSLNYLKHEQFEVFKEIAPFVTRDREPGSFYIQKIK